MCVQPGVCEGGGGLGSERTPIVVLQRRCEQLLQRRRQLEVRHHQVRPPPVPLLLLETSLYVTVVNNCVVTVRLKVWT